MIKIRRSRLFVGILFVVWIGGMIFFFTSNNTRPVTSEERRKHILKGREGHRRDHVNIHRFDLPKDESYVEKDTNNNDNYNNNKEVPEEPQDTRKLEDFDWKTYQEKAGLKPGEDKNERNAYNQEASDALAWDRDVPDVRDASCKKKYYDDDLPTTSIIICFHNEGRAALLRTVVSALNRSPPHLLKEIILVDDFSDNPEDGKELLALPKVVLLRNEKREGLIRSRVRGADIAKGDVLTFLDSHCESNVMWLEPLMQAVKDNPKVVACPIIDVIGHSDFNYLSSSSDLRGGFGWNLNFKWDFLPPHALAEHKADPGAPIRSPAIAGGLFSISKKWFEDLGKYDNQMDVWGGENLEISFRAWQCGGEMVILPCSRVGHVFRDRHPYKFPGGSMNVFQKNSRRAAEVWMDEYKKYYYSAVPSARYASYGDITERSELRKKLGCKSFKWYLENVYPELKVPADDVVKYGVIKQSTSPDFCIDTMGHVSGGTVGLFQCHGQGGNQDWSWTKSEQIKHENVCLAAESYVSVSNVKMIACSADDPMQQWIYNTDKQTLQNKATRKCMELYAPNDPVSLRKCKGIDSQRWLLDMTNS